MQQEESKIEEQGRDKKRMQDLKQIWSAGLDKERKKGTDP